MTYKKILAPLDGSEGSNMAMDAALSLATKTDSSELIGCHVYAAKLHRTRFADMEPGLPGDYQGHKLEGLRKTHEDLIGEGLRMISNAYLEPLAKKACFAGVRYKSLTPEGRNYIEILKATRDELPELIVIGGQGQGQAPFLGSTAERVLLYSQESDILVVRKPWKLNCGKIAVGIDASESSFLALKKALDISTSYEEVEVCVISVYDPFFHSEVFRNISSTLGDKTKGLFDFEAQERIHDEVIDKGLERLYNNGLNEGIKYAKSVGQNINPEILTGKILAQIIKYVSDNEIDLLVLGRWGLHREKLSLIGSNALNIARSAKINVLVVASPPLQDGEESISLRSINNIENRIQDQNDTSKAKLIATKGERNIPEAEIVVLNKINKFAPNFHRHMLDRKIIGQILSAGDKILIYRVAETVPSGHVRITERTRLEVR